jgi:hypothetical protein
VPPAPALCQRSPEMKKATNPHTKIKKQIKTKNKTKEK